jgi:hypothetical protein
MNYCAGCGAALPDTAGELVHHDLRCDLCWRSMLATEAASAAGDHEERRQSGSQIVLQNEQPMDDAGNDAVAQNAAVGMVTGAAMAADHPHGGHHCDNEALCAPARPQERTIAAEGAAGRSAALSGDALVQLSRLLWRYAQDRAPASAPH